jgi:hypothetical protein
VDGPPLALPEFGTVIQAEPLTGGFAHKTWLARLEDGSQVVVKAGEQVPPGMFLAEAEGLEDRPAVAPAGPAPGLDSLDHRRHQLVGELAIATVVPGPEGLGRVHVTLHGLAVDTGPVGYPPEHFVAAHPPAQHFFHLDPLIPP